MAENVEEDSLSRKETMALFSVAVLVFFVSAVFVFTFLSWDDTPNGNGNGSLLPPPPPPNTSGNGSVVPIDTNGSVDNETNGSSLWICGNGKQDPYESCESCPEDLGDTCVCVSPSGTVSADLGENFSLCFDQKAFVGDFSVEFSVKSKPSFKVTFSGDSSSVSLSDEGKGVFVGPDRVFYELFLQKELFHGALLLIDYSHVGEGDTVNLGSVGTVRLGDGDILLSMVEDDSSDINSPAKIKIEKDGNSEIMEIVPDEEFDVDGFVIICMGGGDIPPICEIVEGGD